MQAGCRHCPEPGFAVALHGKRCRAASVIGAAGSGKKVRQASPRHKKSGQRAAFSSFSSGPRVGQTLFALLAAFAVRELLANTSRLSRTIAEVIKLCAPYIAFAFYFNARDERGIS